MNYKIYIASDHGGWQLKNKIKSHLKTKNVELEDIGPEALIPSDDYPDYAYPVAQMVAEDETSLGILICRSGQGVCIVANKVKGIRAGLASNPEMAFDGRNDDHINILCLPSDYINEQEAYKIIDRFIETTPSVDSKYQRRINKIKAIEDDICLK